MWHLKRSNNFCYGFDLNSNSWAPVTGFMPCGPVPLGGAAPCCQPGSYCLSDGICKFDARPEVVAKLNSLYYAALCTDSYGQDAACVNVCTTSLGYYYITYRDGQWKCCWGSKSVRNGTCQDPQGRAIQAAAPGQLSTLTFLNNPSVAVSVLTTALPFSLFKAGLTNTNSFKSYISTVLEHSHTPSWFSAMPTEVQTFYVPSIAQTSPTTTPTTTTSSSRSVHTDTPAPTRDGGSGSINCSMKFGVSVRMVLGVILFVVISFFP